MDNVRPPRSGSITKYAVSTSKHSSQRSNDLQRDRQRRLSQNIAVFSRYNPEEEDTVVAAQWRLLEALNREHSLAYRAQKWWRSLFQIPSTPAHLATVILDHVLLGSDDNAANREQLVAAGVTHVCNCAAQAKNHFEGEFVYLQLHLHDAVDEHISPQFPVVARFLHRVEQLRGRALIHCVAGVSRSATLLIAYLMTHKAMTLREAYYFVRRQRPCVQPNQAFRLQLAKFELTLRGASSVAITSDPDWNFFAWNEIKSKAMPRGQK